MSTLSEIKRLQANAYATLDNVTDFIYNAPEGYEFKRPVLSHLLDEAEGAFNEYLAAAKLLRPSFENICSTKDMAQLWIDSALKERAKK